MKKNHIEQKSLRNPNQFIDHAIEKVFGISWHCEVILAAFMSILIGVLFAIFGRGGPVSSDLLLYMNVSINRIGDPFILNRYFYVFLQGFFLRIAPQPLIGYHYYWGFTIAVIIFLIYVCVRKITVRSNFLHGLLAIFIFLAITGLPEIAGINEVDFSAAMMILAVVAVYLFSVEKKNDHPLIIIFLGIVFFLAFKTKETTIPVAILFLGLGWVGDNEFDWKYLLRNIKWLTLGIALGIIGFSLLNLIFLGDLYFGLRPAEWIIFFETYVPSPSFNEGIVNGISYLDWFGGFFFAQLLIPFLLFILSGIIFSPKMKKPVRIIWYLPLIYILMLIFSISDMWGYLLRFALPIIPVICVLAALTFDLSAFNSPDHRKKQLIFLGAGLLIMLGVRLLLRVIFPADLFDRAAIIYLVYHPVLFALLIFVLFQNKEKPLVNLAGYILVVSILLTPFLSNMREILISRKNEQEFSQIVASFSEIEEHVSFHPEMRFYITNHVFAHTEIVKNVDEVLMLFNIYFNENSTRRNFWFVEYPPDITGNILAERFDYALISQREWQMMQQNEIEWNQVTEVYDAFYDTDEQFVLLINRE